MHKHIGVICDHCKMIKMVTIANTGFILFYLFFFRFHDPLESDTVVVYAIQSEHQIASYRLVKPSKYSKLKRPSQSERRMSKMERFEKEGPGRKESIKETGERPADKRLYIHIAKISKKT